MFDLGATEILLIVVVAVLVIGPKDLPLALRTAGRWMGKMRRVSSHFRTGLDAMIREAEMEEMEKKWRDQNDQIMREHPEGLPPGAGGEPVDAPEITASEPEADSDNPPAGDSAEQAPPADKPSSAG